MVISHLSLVFVFSVFLRSMLTQLYHTNVLHQRKGCGIFLSGDKMIINSVIKNEALRNDQMIEQYEKLIAELPKGTLILRKNEYYYLKYRKDGKICDDYIGKDPAKVASIREKIEQRKHYEQMLASLKRERKTIHKLLEELK